MSITLPPPAPSRNNPATFSDRMDAFLAWFVTMAPELNALAYATGPGLFLDGGAIAPSIAFANDADTGLYRPAANQLAMATAGVRRLLLGTSTFQVDLPITGTAVTQSSTDTTTGRLHRTDDNMLYHVLRRFGGYYPSGSGVNIDSAVVGDAGLYHDGNAGTFPGGASGNFWWISTQAMYAGSAAMQRAILYSGTGTPPNTRNEYMRIRANDGTWGAWRTVYNSGSVVGAVNQSGGVPTGALIERGSNANGDYVRFADGTQICWASITTTDQAIDSAYGDFGIHIGSRVWMFPATFSAPPAVPAPSARWGTGASWGSVAGAPSVSSVILRFFDVFPRAAGTTFTATFTATGRWF